MRRGPALSLVGLLGLVGCAKDGGGATVPGTGSGPSLVDASLSLPPSDKVSLVRILDITADAPCTVTARLVADDGEALVRTSDTLATSHTLPILGLRFDRTFTVTVDLTDGSGATTKDIAVSTFTAEPTPDEWPIVDVLTSTPDQMEPGVTLFALSSYNGGTYYLVAMDERGRVVWLYDSGNAFVLDAHTDRDGNILALLQEDLVRLTWLGEELGRWNEDGSRAGIAVPGGEFHHEAYEMPDGNLLALSRRVVHSDAYPASYADPAPTRSTDVMSHTVMEIAPDGTVVVQHDLWDILDRQRIAYDGLNEATGGGVAGAMDWVHSNAAYYDASDDTYVISLRHQDALVKIRRSTGDLVWILGTPDNWGPAFQQYLLTPVGDVEWPFHPHGPELAYDGRIYVFDNGNYRVSPWTGEPMPEHTEQYSRLVAYEVDPTAMTVSQPWEFVAPGDSVLFSYATGDANLMPQTGNVLGTYGFTEVVDGVETTDLGWGWGSSRLIEVNPVTDEVVWDVWFRSDAAVLPDGWNGYRAVRVPLGGGAL